MPSSLRSYPFRLLRPEGSEQMALCIDEDSGLVADADEKGRTSSLPTASRRSPPRNSWSSCARSKPTG